MRVVYIDIDSLRADHLGCYGYHRDTSPNIDAIAADGVRFEAVHASDVPCLPSRTALITGRFGINTGLVSHGGTAGELRGDGPTRGFRSLVGARSWTMMMRPMRSASISTFAERHAAYHWHAGFNETHNLGTFGMETADEVSAAAIDWLERNGAADDWFLHVNLWDPHNPYRTPASFGDPFADEPLPAWHTEEVRARNWTLPGPHSAQEVMGFGGEESYAQAVPRQPFALTDMDQVRRLFDGYDTGVRFADHHIGRICDALDGLGVLDETAIVISADHGENLGELGIYGDHHTADLHTTRIPLVVRWPGVPGGRTDRALHYQVDMAATVLELLGKRVSSTWDGVSFAGAMREGREEGRDHLVLSQAAWCVQRAVRIGDMLWIRTYHDAFHGFDDEMLFDLADDPHEQRSILAERHDVALRAAELLEAFTDGKDDPFDVVMAEGGGWHIRDTRDGYLERLRATDRAAWADRIASRG